VLAPEQELLTEEILPYIPHDRIDDVVYMNPSDTDYPIPFNSTLAILLEMRYQEK